MCHYMFVRFRHTAQRLQVSLAETRREGEHVRQDHVASLGSIAAVHAPAARIEFWTTLHQRLAGLSNRIDGRAHGAILAAVHARIPMPHQDEHSTTQIAHARADASTWHAIADMNAGTAAEKRELVVTLTREIEAHDAQAAAAAERATAADDRLARAERGEAVAGIPKPMTRKQFLAAAGITERTARFYQQLATELPDEATFAAFLAEKARLDRRGDKAHQRAALRKAAET
jgi:hypothetical protein